MAGTWYYDRNYKSEIKTQFEELLKGNHLRVPIDEQIMFDTMVKGWFTKTKPSYNAFVKAMFMGEIDAMNEYMNRITCEIFSYFDTGKRGSDKAEPECFYHGFVLGLMVDLQADYLVTSNRESGFGRKTI